MAKLDLKKFLARSEIRPLIREVAAGIDRSAGISDRDGTVLLAGAPEGAHRFPVELQGELLGWVNGTEAAAPLASLLTHLVRTEYEKKSLAQETLNKYRELNLFYDLAEKLSGNLEQQELARFLIDEAGKLIRMTRASVLLLNQQSGAMEAVATLDGSPGDSGSEPCAAGPGSSISVALRTKEGVVGSITIANDHSFTYASEEHKLLAALAAQASLFVENARLYHNLEESFFSSMHILAETVETRDAYTGGHVKRVMNHSLAIGEAMELSKKELNDLKFAAILHDIGKIGIRDNILLKEGPLTSEEFAMIRSHTIFGAIMLNNVKHFQSIAPVIRGHHENFDGTGYPDGLGGEDIPLLSRIIAVADSYDAMTTDRVYRPALGDDYAVAELEKYAGLQFDPEVVKIFLGLRSAENMA